MGELVIFGTGTLAEVLQFYLRTESPFDVAAFTVDGEKLRQDTFCGLPVVAFEEVARRFPPASHRMIVSVGYSDLNASRERKCREASARGYELASYVHGSSHCPSNVRLGANCIILERNTLHPFASLGDNVVIWSNNVIGHHSRIDDNVFITSGTVIGGKARIGRNTFIGPGVIVVNDVAVGAGCLLGAAALITADAEPGGVYKTSAATRSRVPASRVKL